MNRRGFQMLFAYLHKISCPSGYRCLVNIHTCRNLFLSMAGQPQLKSGFQMLSTA